MGRVADVGEEDVGEEVHTKSMGKSVLCMRCVPKWNNFVNTGAMNFIFVPVYSYLKELSLYILTTS